MISPPERRAALRAALRAGLLTDGLRLLALPARHAVYEWRRRPTTSRMPAVPPPTPAEPATDYNSARLHEISRRAQALYRVELPPARTSGDGVRLAGGRRSKRPGGAVVSEDIQDLHAWNRLYWTLETPAIDVAEHLDHWLHSSLAPEDLHP
jgi:hypothetical protein